MTITDFGDELKQTLLDNDILCNTYINDLGTLLLEEEKNNKKLRQSSSEEFNLTIYHDYYEVNDYVMDRNGHDTRII